MSRTLIPIVVAFLPAFALADAQIQMVGTDGKVDGTYQIKGSRVRMDSVDSGDNAMIYDAATHSVTVVDRGRQRYMHIDAETVANASAAVSGAMAEMEKQLANLPPEQREAMKKYMPAMPSTTTAKMPDIKAERTGKTDVVNGTSCDVVTVTMDGKAAGEACVAARGSGLSDADAQTLRTMFQDMSKMASGVLGHSEGTEQQFSALGGVPLRWRDADTGRVTETRVDSKIAIDAAAFEVPAGYTEEKLEIPNLSR